MKEVNNLNNVSLLSSLYAASPLVSRARSYLYSSMIGSLTGYRSRYERQITSLYSQVMNRPAFSYSAEKDPLYQQYRNQYLREGQRAMQDTVGAAAALTGGYGSSWANTAGYQAYGQYLQALNDKLPELEERARERYQAESDTLRDRLSLTMNMDDREYSRYRDRMSDLQNNGGLTSAQQLFDLQLQSYLSAMAAYPLGIASVISNGMYGNPPAEESQGYRPSKRAVKAVAAKTALAKTKLGG